MNTIEIKTTIREQIYDILKNRILSEYYAPGKKLSEVEICRELGVSRSPLREALRQLEADGLVSGTANKGVCVRKLNEKDVKDLYQVEIMIQNTSIQLGAQNIDEAKRKIFEELAEEFSQTYNSGDFDAYLSASEKLHNEIVSLCSNEITEGIYRQIGIRNYRFRLMSLKNPERFRNSYQEHLGIINALLSGDTALAQQIMLRHLQSASEVVTLQVTKLKESDL
ncbi:MAG: GntR family transcriptional regulator [Solobacterium sp.]|nr:GntR family transcriptional regulator [Solobacterium sp.]